MATGLNGAFLDELLKIATEYKKVRGATSQLRQDIPLMQLRGKVDAARVTGRIAQAVSKSQGKVLGHATVALATKQLPQLPEMGFKPTRLAVPLSGETGLLPKSYRKGQLHGHQVGDLTLFHLDQTVPSGLKTIKHGIVEGTPALMKRVWQQEVPPVRTTA